jgi:hypothetical protein
MALQNPLALTNPVQLTVNGSAPFGITDSLGRLIDDARNGAAGGLTPGANLDGIATDGTNIWLLDGNKVFEYAGAASRTSGSQAASATFALAPGNTAPVGIADPPTDIPSVSGATAHTGASPAPAQPAPQVTLDRRSTRFIATHGRGTAAPTVLQTPAAGPQVAPVLGTLTPSSDQDLTLLALDLIRSGKKRAGTSIRS